VPPTGVLYYKYKHPEAKEEEVIQMMRKKNTISGFMIKILKGRRIKRYSIRR
jgi:hypothetical protein